MRKFFFLLLVLSGIFPAYSIDTHWNLEPVVIKNGVSEILFIMFVMEVTVLYGSLLIKEFHVMTDLDFVTIPSLWGLILFPLLCIKL